jgi:hypothetical protein
LLGGKLVFVLINLERNVSQNGCIGLGGDIWHLTHSISYQPLFGKDGNKLPGFFLIFGIFGWAHEKQKTKQNFSVVWPLVTEIYLSTQVFYLEAGPKLWNNHNIFVS